MTGLRFLTASTHDLLVECTDLVATMHLHRALTEAGLPGIRELIPAARTELVRFDPALTSASVLETAIRGLDRRTTGADHSREVTIAVDYDGEDLADVAALLNVSPAEVVRRHQAATWQVAFSGFAPGFGYLAGDDPLFAVPRRSSPRTRVPAGSVALAGEFTGVYPTSSPGGWQLIGRTEAVLWDLDREPPALFVPGTTVRFVTADRGRIDVATSAGADTTATGSRESDTSASATNEAGAASAGAVSVVRPGLQLLLQDLGRPGFAAMGVSAAGAADRRALREANRCAGNDDGAAVLESYGGGAIIRFTGDGVAAVTGAEGGITLTRDDGGIDQCPLGAPFSVAAGDELSLDTPTAGIRRYLAVRGGFSAPRVLESLSTDTLAHLGPAALRAGQTLALGDPALAPHSVAVPPRTVHAARSDADGRRLPRVGESTTLAVTLGPRDDWFTSAGIATLFDQEWTVTTDSDRVGLRLSGDTPLERSLTGELPSEGAVTGALQVPPNGQPVLFGPDHPLTGGYPIIASVIDTDLAAQLPPGARVRFVLADPDPAADPTITPAPSHLATTEG